MTICKEGQRIGQPHFKGYIWLAIAWQGGHVGGQYNKQIFQRIYVKVVFSSQRRETLLFLITDTADVSLNATSNNLATWNSYYFFIVLQSEWQCLVFITLFKETEVQSKKRDMLSPWINVVQIRHRKKKHIMNNTEKLYLHNERQWKAKHPSGRQFQTAASRALIDITFRHSISSDTTKKMITCNYCTLWRTGTFPSLQVRLALYRTMINRLRDQRS